MSSPEIDKSIAIIKNINKKEKINIITEFIKLSDIFWLLYLVIIILFGYINFLIWFIKKINNKTCSIFQVPTSEKGDYSNRGAVLFYVFKEGAAEYVRVDAGYPYDSQKYVKVTIDSKNYQFFGEDDSAWSMADDTVIIKALKAVGAV